MKASVEVICYKVRPMKNGEYPLMLRITKSRKRKYVSIGMSIDEKLWDFDKNKPKRNCPNKEAIEKLITSKVSEYNDLIVTMTTERKEYTPQSLSQIIDNKVQCKTVTNCTNGTNFISGTDKKTKVFFLKKHQKKFLRVKKKINPSIEIPKHPQSKAPVFFCGKI